MDNEYPSYDTLGNPIKQGSEFPNGPSFAIGPQTIPTIGDALSAANVSSLARIGILDPVLSVINVGVMDSRAE